MKKEPLIVKVLCLWVHAAVSCSLFTLPLICTTLNLEYLSLAELGNLIELDVYPLISTAAATSLNTMFALTGLLLSCVVYCVQCTGQFGVYSVWCTVYWAV